MRALTWHGKHDVRVDTVPDPQIVNPRDAIIKITATAICGSDLHLYDGYIPTMQAGDVLGHEFMGEVVEVGPGNQKLKKGDKVVLWYISANFDEDQFPDAQTFIPDRSPNDHVAFGLHSAHLCLGAHLARLELRVMFEEMAKAWTSIEANGPAERFRSNFISGTKRLPVKVSWR